MRKRILVAEDDTSVAFLIKNGLADLGATFDIETVPSGEAALEKIRQSKWDLIITDHRMAGITGLNLLEQVRQHVPTLPSILMTGYGSDEVEQAARRLNVYHYLTKPFALARLKFIIEKALALNLNVESPEPEKGKDSTALKITLSGDQNVGKSTLITRLCTGKFDRWHVTTLGVDFHLHDIQNTQLSTRLILWDSSRQNLIDQRHRAFYRGSKAVGLVYAVNYRASFERLPIWRDEIRTIVPSAPFVLVGNKTDLKRCVSTTEGASLAQAWGIPFAEASCVSGDGVEQFFGFLADAAQQNAA